jgi:tripartite-type tricarboxylate transporter receptor subunit TctC
VTTAARLDSWPGLPTVAETVPGFEATGWLGVGAPAHTPDAIVDKLNKAISAELENAKVKSQLADLGCVLQPMTPGECQTFVAAEAVKWAKVIKFADIKVD